MRILVTGGSGFIGSHLVESILERPEVDLVLNIDRLDECSTMRNHPNNSDGRFLFLKRDLSVSKPQDLCSIMIEHEIDFIIHAAASTLVDASFENGLGFTVNNVLSTQIILECMRILYTKGRPINRLIYVSTDEVLGDSTLLPFREPHDHTAQSNQLPLSLNPTNPYAASKAAAECIVRAYQISFNLPIVIVRSSNVYGPRQYPEKVIPNFILKSIRGEKLLVHGDGSNLRSYLHVRDFCLAVLIILSKPTVDGTIYCCVGEEELSVKTIAIKILKAINRINDDTLTADQVCYVKDRLYNDKRYEMDSSAIRELGWQPKIDFNSGLQETILWYRQSGQHWWGK